MRLAHEYYHGMGLGHDKNVNSILNEVPWLSGGAILLDGPRLFVRHSYYGTHNEYRSSCR